MLIRGAPWTITASIVIWFVVQTIQYVKGRQTDFPQRVEFDVADVLQFVHGYLLVFLISFGLLKKSSVVWSVAFVWLAITGAFGVINITLNDYGWFQFRHLILWDGTLLPIAVALITGALLLLPPTTRWMTARESV